MSDLKAKPNLTCAECGVFGAIDFGHLRLCLNCYVEKGSCCSLERDEDLPCSPQPDGAEIRENSDDLRSAAR
jgi:hypothetical protein